MAKARKVALDGIASARNAAQSKLQSLVPLRALSVGCQLGCTSIRQAPYSEALSGQHRAVLAGGFWPKGIHKALSAH